MRQESSYIPWKAEARSQNIRFLGRGACEVVRFNRPNRMTRTPPLSLHTLKMSPSSVCSRERGRVRGARLSIHGKSPHILTRGWSAIGPQFGVRWLDRVRLGCFCAALPSLSIPSVTAHAYRSNTICYLFAMNSRVLRTSGLS